MLWLLGQFAVSMLLHWGRVGPDRSPRVDDAAVEALSARDLTMGALIGACAKHNEQEVIDAARDLQAAGKVTGHPGNHLAPVTPPGNP